MHFSPNNHSPKDHSILHCLCSSHLSGAQILQPGIASRPAGVWRRCKTCQSQAAVPSSSKQNPLHFWRRLWIHNHYWHHWDVNSGRDLSPISATNLKTWRKPDLNLLVATHSLLSRVSKEAGNPVTFLPDSLNSTKITSAPFLPAGSWQLQQERPFLYSWGESDQQGNMLERRPDSVLMGLRCPSLQTTRHNLNVASTVEGCEFPLLLSPFLET